MAKKILAALAGIFALLLIAAIVIPLVVDVDRYRPQIVAKANEQINGKLELGKLKLSLWGRVRIVVEGLTLSDARGHKMISVQDAHFHLPLMSILSGEPLITFRMDKPEIEVIQDKAGQLNLMTLVKKDAVAVSTPAGTAATPPAGAPSQGQPQSAPPQASVPAPTKSGKAAAAGDSVTLPALALRARLGIEFSDARILYKDEKAGSQTRIQDLQLSVRDVSLSRPTELELRAKLDTQVGKTMQVRGPLKLTARTQVTMGPRGLEELTAKFKVDLDQLDVTMPGLFHKKAGLAMNAEGSLKSTPREARIEQLDLRFNNAELRASGMLSNLEGASPIVQLDLKSNDIALAGWTDLVPMLASYGLGGSVSLEAQANGPSDKLGYSANLSIKGVTAQAPRLKAKPRIDGVIRVATDRIESIALAMKAPGNELSLRGKVLGITSAKPRADLEISSSGMDLDQLVDWPPPAPKKGASLGVKNAWAGPAPEETADYDALVAPLRASAPARAFVANAGFNLKTVKAYGVVLSGIQGKMALDQLVAALTGFEFRLWDGIFKAGMKIDLKPAKPTYQFDTSVRGLDLKQAVSSQLQLFKNTILGKADFQITGKGTSFNPPAAKAALDAQGSLSVTDATFATVDVSKMATESINQSLQKVGDKIPALRGKKLGGGLSKESRYERISSSFTISGGKFRAPDFYAKAMEKQGIDLKGNTTVGLIDLSLKADWEIIDTYNLTRAADLEDGILLEKGKPFRVPVSAGCNVMDPCYSYTQAPEFLAKVAATNFAKSAVLKQVESKAPPALRKSIKGLGKKLFGR